MVVVVDDYDEERPCGIVVGVRVESEKNKFRLLFCNGSSLGNLAYHNSTLVELPSIGEGFRQNVPQLIHL